MFKYLILIAAAISVAMPIHAETVTLTISEDQGFGNYIVSATSDDRAFVGVLIVVHGVQDIDADLGFMVVNTLYYDEALALNYDGISDSLYRDSHLLFNRADVGLTQLQQDDSTLSISANLNTPVTHLDIANIVPLSPLTHPLSVELDITVAVVAGYGPDKDSYYSDKGEMIIIDHSPEPASLSLIAMASLAVFRRN